MVGLTARVRLTFGHLQTRRRGHHIGHELGGDGQRSHAERITRVLAPGSVTIRATSATNNGL